MRTSRVAGWGQQGEHATSKLGSSTSVGVAVLRRGDRRPGARRRQTHLSVDSPPRRLPLEDGRARSAYATVGCVAATPFAFFAAPVVLAAPEPRGSGPPLC